MHFFETDLLRISICNFFSATLNSALRYLAVIVRIPAHFSIWWKCAQCNEYNFIKVFSGFFEFSTFFFVWLIFARAFFPLSYFEVCITFNFSSTAMPTDYGRPVRKSPSLHGRKSNTNLKFLGAAKAYCFYQIGPKFQNVLIYAFIWCPSIVRGHADASLHQFQ